jgi:hypothetical protein
VAKIDWNADSVAKLSQKELENLRANAIRLQKPEVAALCDAEIARRTPRKMSNASKGRNQPKNGPVLGFHFVCGNDRGVTINSDGTFSTETWVVDKRHADRAMKLQGYVALHVNRATPSYRQGTTKAWRLVDREKQYGDQPARIESGIEFLIHPTDDPYTWVGEGTGEKGYARVSSQPAVDAPKLTSTSKVAAP